MPQLMNGEAHRTQGDTSFRMVNQSLIVTYCDLSLARGVGIDLDVGAAILLASFGRCIAVNRFVWTIAGCSKSRSGKAILLHQVVLDLVRPRTRRVGVAIDIDDRVLIRAHGAGEFIYDGTRIEAHGGRVRIEVDGA